MNSRFFANAIGDFSIAVFVLLTVVLGMPARPAAQEVILNAPRAKSGGTIARLEKLPSSKKLALLKRSAARINVDEIEPNDSQSTAQELSGSSPIVVNGSAETADIGESTIEYQDGSRDDVEDLYLLTIAQAGLRINLSGNASDIDIFLFDSPITQIIDGSNSSGVGGEEIIQSSLTPGTYIIGVTIYDLDPSGPNTSPYVLTVTYGAGVNQPPANDECATATTITALPFTDQVNTRTATVAATDPELPCADGGGGKTVWYKFTATKNAAVNVSTLGSTPEDYDTALGVFTGSCVNLDLVVCNDDQVFGIVRQADTSFTATAGETYYILIAEWNGGGPDGGVPTGGDLVFSMREETLYQGPASGSIPGGAMVSTDDITGASVRDKRVSSADMHLSLHDRTIELIDNTNGAMPEVNWPRSNFYSDAATAGDAELAQKSLAQANFPFPVRSFAGLEDTDLIPPDPIMAAGPEHIVGVVNSSFGIFDKSGTLLKLINAAEWYENVLPEAFPCDPQIIFDPHSSRWFMIWIECGTEAAPSLLLSVSDDANPLGAWCNWRLPGDVNGSTFNGLANDFPKLGIDQEALYVTSNMFGNSFEYVQLRIIPKQQLLGNSCGPVIYTDFWNLRDPDNLAINVVTLVPALTFGTPGTEYLINDAPYEIGTFVTLWSVTNPLAASPSLTAVNVPVDTSYGVATDAEQLGGGDPIDTSDRRFRNAVYRDGSLWTAHSVPGGTNNAFGLARYLRINTTTATAIEDVAFGADDFWYYYPAVMIDQNSNLTMVVNRSGATEYAGIRYTGRLNADPPGLPASAQLKAGESNYVKTFGGARNRWGDYNGIALDPSDPDRIWMFAEYAETPVGPAEVDQRWGTWFGQTTFTPLGGNQISVEPLEIYFGKVGMNAGGPSVAVTLRSIGDQSLTVSGIVSSTNNFVLENLPVFPAVVPANSSLEFFIRFSPTLPAPAAGTITITSNDPETPIVQIALGGEIGEDINLSTNILSATLQTGDYTTLNFAIENLGPANLYYQISANGVGAFGLPTTNGLRVLSTARVVAATSGDLNQENGNKEYNEGTAAGSAAVPLRHTSPDQEFLEQVRAGATPAMARLNEPANVLQAGGARSIFNYDVGTVTGELLAIGVEFDGEYFWVTGAGATGSIDPNRLFKFDVAGNLVATYEQSTASEIGWTDLAYDGTFLYAGDGDHIDQIDPATGAATGVTIPSPHLVNVALAYDPATDHFWTASFGSTLYEIDRAGNIVNEYENSLTIIGLAWDAASPGGPYLWSWSQDADGTLASRFAPATGTFSSVVFIGDENIGGVAGGATFTNALPTQPAGLGVLVTLHQAQPQDFIAGYAVTPVWVADIDPAGGVVGPVGNTVVNLKIDADNLAPGSYEAALIVGSSDADEERLPISLTLTVNAAQGSQMRLDPARKDFGAILLGVETDAATLSIRSIGTQTLSISNVTSSNPDFVLDIASTSFDLAPGGKIDFAVSFFPQGPGLRNGEIVLTSNDSDEPVKKILLTGYGVPQGAAEPGALYAVSGAADGGRFFSIDATSGQASLTGSTGFADISALAINSVGEIYAVTPATPSTLLKIDAATGAGSIVGQMNIGRVHALTFDANDVLYGATGETNSVLYTIAIPGTQATVIDSTGVNCISGIAFSPLGVLYAVTSTNCSSAAGDQLYTLDTATAAATLVGTVGFSGSIPDIAFDLDGNLFGVIGDDAAQPHSLIAIDPSTAIGAYIGPLGFQAINGLSFFKADPTAVDDANEPPPAPATFALEQNYPNPFNPSTRIRYSISNASQVALKIYSLLGQQVRTLVDEKQNPNTYEVTWDGRDDGGVSMPTGIYFYQIRAGNEVATRRMLFLK